MAAVWRWIKRSLLGFLALVGILLVVGISYEQLSRFRLPKNHPPPGVLIMVDGRKQHLHCIGQGAPTVILESGFTVNGSLHWYKVQPAASQSTKVCSYDRGGIMWSDPGPSPRDGNRVTDELHALLQSAGVTPPFVMVAHSVGGVLARIYDRRFPGEIAGFVFVDSAHPEQQQRLPQNGNDSPGPPPGLSFFTGTGIVRSMMLPADPPAGTDADVHATEMAYWPISAHAMYAELAAVETTVREEEIRRNLNPRPIIVLSRGMFSSDEERLAWSEMQNEIAALSQNSIHRVVQDTGHDIQMERPDAVIEAIEELVAAVREGVPLSGR
jgi:pimeloyl-ACP methyl ester carboxylesterase